MERNIKKEEKRHSQMFSESNNPNSEN